jgi:hypothetical protein
MTEQEKADLLIQGDRIGRFDCIVKRISETSLIVSKTYLDLVGFFCCFFF